MEKNVIQINDGITTNVDVSVKYHMCVKKIIYGVRLLETIQRLRVMKSLRKKQKQLQQILMKRKNL